MNPLTRWAACAGLVLGSLVPVAGPATMACAGESRRAALVVDTGQNVHRFCVGLPADEVSGLELIVLANEQHGLSYRFGHGGGAVCMLAEVGASGDDCFGSYPDFWGYWRGSSGGGWTWSSSGAGSTSVGDGDVEGWSWGSGNDGSSHPGPPATTYSSVCPAPPASAGDDAPARPSGGSGKQPSGGSPSAAPPPPGPARSAPGEQDLRTARPRGDRAETQDAPSRRRLDQSRKQTRKSVAGPESPGPTPDGNSSLAARSASDVRKRGSVPPTTGVAALSVAALVGAAGFVLARRRRGRP